MKYRRDQLYKTDHKLYGRQVGYLVSFIRDTPALAAITGHIECAEPDIVPQKWVTENFGWHTDNRLVNGT